MDCSRWHSLIVSAAFLIFLVSAPPSPNAAEIPPKNFSVLVSAHALEFGEGGPQLILTWPPDPAATRYTINKRSVARDEGWHFAAYRPGSAENFYDAVVTIGEAYEYQIIKETSAGYTGYGYIRAGIRVPAPADYGKLILIVENSLASALAPELSRLENDIRNEGWDVIRRNVSINDSPQAVKARIQEIYNADPQRVRALFLFGHVPVPYSGDIAPDGHQNHRGAWPADVYYGDIDGPWTDQFVNSITAERQANWNVPGDGKFDQSEPPSQVELWVGRVDLHNMTCYANKPNSRSELDLMRQYLNKNHNFRWGRVPFQRRALVCDNFSDKGSDPIGGSAWRNFPAFFNYTNIHEVGWDGYLPAATSGSYLWSFASGGGSYYYSSGVATSDDFALQNVRVVFAMFMGSYFGDWNNESNFLRASLGSGDVLAASYSGFPQALYFPMGLGEPIGYANWLAQNNDTNGLYEPWGQGTHQVHISLHGDPTLRMFPVQPVASASAALNDGVVVSWSASPDFSIQGYSVYRSSFPDSGFARISGDSLIAGTSFYDPTGTENHFYQVRTFKLEHSGSGTFLNPSQPVLASWSATTPPPAAPSNFIGVPISTTQIRLQWTDNSDNESGFRIFRSVGADGTWTSFTVPADTTVYYDSNLTADTEYSYRIQSFHSSGASPESPTISVTTPAPPPPANTATFVKSDATTSGSWKGTYGYDGAIAPYSDFLVPSYVQVNANNNYPLIWENPSSQPSALQKRLSSARFATTWQHSSPFLFFLRFADTNVHRVSFYFLDWEAVGRQQKIDLYDYDSGALLASRTITDFASGVYSTWDLKGKIMIRLSAAGPGTSVLSAIFFDPQTAPTRDNDALPIALDPNTAGSWKGVYGEEGGLAPYSDFTRTANVQVSAYLNYPHVWENPSTRPAALEKRTSSTRFATTWQHSSSFYFNLQFGDDLWHRVSLYFHDFEALGRLQRIEALDYLTKEPLATETISNFQEGLYSTWHLRGKVTFKITPLAAGTAVLSGIFFDPAPGASPNAIRYLGADTTTGGSWKGQFGAEGYRIAGDASQLPADLAISLTGQLEHIWNYNTADPAALERATSAGRIASCWYAPEFFELAVQLPEAASRKITFYSLDWDAQNRIQKIEVFDASTGALLHTASLSAFQDGAYHSYDVQGSVRFRFTRTGPLNAVTSGIFIDPPSAPF